MNAPNVFINGVGSDFPSKQSLLDSLFATETELYNYSNNGKDISFYYDGSFGGFNSDFVNATDILILEDVLNSLINYSFGNPNRSLINFLSTANPTSQINTLRNKEALKRCFIPNTTTLGQSTGDDAFFTNSSPFLICDNVLSTNNGGSPDGDINRLVNTESGSVKYSTDKTLPVDVTDLSSVSVGATYAYLDFTIPAHVNTMSYALVFVGNFWVGIFDINEVFAIKMPSGTTSLIKIIVADEFFNLSGFSNQIAVTTTNLNPLFNNTKAYYKLEETTGDTLDVVGGYNGAVYGDVTRSISGLIGDCYSFGGVNGFVQTSLNPIGLGWTNISTYFWFRTADTSSGSHIMWGLATADTNLGTRLRISIENGKIWVRVQGAISYTGSFNDGNWHHLVMNCDPTGTTTDIEIYVDNVQLSIDSDSATQLAIPSSNLSIGAQYDSFAPYQGDLDEIEVRETPYTPTERSDLYNSGNGITI